MTSTVHNKGELVRGFEARTLEVGTELVAFQDFTLRLSSGSREVKLEISALESLQPVLVELKRLMAVAQQRGYVLDGGTHNWVQFYENNRKSASAALTQAEKYNEAEEERAQSSLPNPFINLDSSVSGGNVKAIKEAWAAKELRAREDKFVDFESKRVFVGSWNVNGQSPSQSIAPWLQATEEDPSLFVLGFQELDLNTQAYLYSDTTKEEEWSKAIEQALKSRGKKYVKVASKQLVGMLIVLYIDERERDKVKEISAEYLGTGLLGMMGNKGATAIRFRYYDSYFCFVNSHLAADASMVERRNQDYQEICRRIVFNLPSQYPDFTAYTHSNPWVASYYDSRHSAASSIAVAGAPTGPGKSTTTVFDVECVFTDLNICLRDLNYRISLPGSDVKALVSKGDIEQLLQFDQLLMEQSAKRAFNGFKEGPITFPPTFKYDIGTSRFDTSEKQRTPSFCDRILWFQNPLHTEDPDWAKVLWYRSCMDLTMSDHKPVMALFETKVRKVDKERFITVHEDIHRELDKFENESLPDLVVNLNMLEFGDIRFNVPVTKTLVVENKGQVLAQYRFIPKPDEKHPCKPWCYINPPVSMLLPGDQVKVNVTVLVDNETAPSMNFGIDTLDDILILHTENGKDHFLSISGTWLNSCFGNKLDALCRFVKPVRELTLEERKSVLDLSEGSPERDASTDNGAESAEGSERTIDDHEDGLSPTPPKPGADNRFSLPFQLWRVIDFLFRFGMDIDNLFTSSGDPATEEYIRECLDTGAEFDVSVLLMDPDSEPPESADDADDDEADDEDGDTSRRSSTTDSPTPPSGSRTPVEKRASVKVDIDKLLKDNPHVHSQTLVGLGSSTHIIPSGNPIPRPRPRGRAVAVCSMAETLIKFLDSLLEPVVPDGMSTRCIQEGYLTYVAARQTVQRLPSTNYNVFKYVVKFLRAIVENYKGRGELNVERLAEIFGPALLRIPKSLDGSATNSSESLAQFNTNRAPAVSSVNKRSSSGIKYATVSTGKSGQLAGKVMMGGGTGGAIGVTLPGTTTPAGSTANLATARSGSGNAEEVMIRKRRMFLMHFVDLANPELD
ncbi:hypothetical protein SpCBS45565_g07773 [Spizellomyces sp. 'palustris']|nr:hypothetical protein SpCBS45565_g07773 [Spizellomyces sp. 'palustris']